MNFLQQHKLCQQSAGFTTRPDLVHVCNKNNRWCTLSNCKEADDTFKLKFRDGLVMPLEKR